MIKGIFYKNKRSYSNIRVNGESIEKTSYTIVNIQFPLEDKMLLFNLDLSGIAVSGGSACQSGSSKGSHVLRELLSEKKKEMLL